MGNFVKDTEEQTSVFSSHIKERVSSISSSSVKVTEPSKFSEMFSMRMKEIVENNNWGENTFSSANDKFNLQHKDLEKIILDKSKLFNNSKLHYISYNNVYYKKTQRWQGIITKIEDLYFEARLTDLTKGGTDEIAEFYLEEISPADRKLVLLGAVFYWSIGYKYTNGQITKESLIRLQRLPIITSTEFDEMADKAKYLSNSIEWS